MAYLGESNSFDPDGPAQVHGVEGEGELFDPGGLGSVTLEQRKIIELLARNYEIKDIAELRGTQPEQIDLVLASIRIQTNLPLNELASQLIENGAIFVPAPADYIDEDNADLGLPDDSAPELADAGPTFTEPIEPVESFNPKEPSSEITVTPEKEESQRDIRRQHLQDFLAWMYPNENLEERFDLSHEDAEALAEAIRLATNKYDKSLKQPRKRHTPLPAVKYMELWLQGNGVGQIAALAGKNEGTVRLSLEPFAEKIGKFIPLHELLEQAADGRRSSRSPADI